MEESWGDASEAGPVSVKPGAPASGSGQETKSASMNKNEVDKIEGAYRKRQKSWEEVLLLDVDQPHLGSWIKGQRNSVSSFVVYCVACRAHETVQMKGQKSCKKDLNLCWGRGKEIKSVQELKMSHAKKHADTPMHKRAVSVLLHGAVEHGAPDDDNMKRFPGLDGFMKVWAELHNGVSCRGVGSSNICGSRFKVGSMAACLAEACQAEDRRCLRDCSVLAIHQDARKGVLQVRYSACLPDWTVKKGLLGLDLNPGTLSGEICNAIERILRRFCTVNEEFDGDLYEHIRSCVELLDADAASDEQRSLRLLTASLFRNVKIQVRDPAHCARRLATSPWAVDAYLADVHSFYIQSQDSITNVIQHSPDLRNMFGDNVTQLQANVNLPLSESSLKRIRSLDYAAHRFESMCKPLCRFVLLFDSIWRTAADVAVKRNGTMPAKRARMFLEQSTVEGLLQLALLADASLQCMDVIRFYDSEAWHHRVAGFDCRNVFCFLGLAISDI